MRNIKSIWNEEGAMKLKYLLFCISFMFCSPDLWAQEPHMRNPKSVEELLQKNDPARFNAIQNHDKYLILDKIGSTKRVERYIGEMISFKTFDKLRFVGELSDLSDSTMTLTYFDKTENRYIARLFYLKDIRIFYKRVVDPGIAYKFSPLFLLPIVFDWIFLQTAPWDNDQIGETLAIMGAIEVGRVMLLNKDKFFNKIKLKGKWRIRVFQFQ